MWSVTKHLVDIDDDLLEQARSAAGTATIKATVEAGLRRLTAEHLVARHVRRLREADALDLDAADEARTPRG
jgi:Arc/MetJ family transcription regulator